MIETLRMDHVRTARAKGAGERRVVLVHAFRNALIPVVTVMALNFGTLFGGALLTETMFAHPGMGKMIYDSILGNDYNLALTGLLFATLITLLSNLGADIAYGWLDPRITTAMSAIRHSALRRCAPRRRSACGGCAGGGSAGTAPGWRRCVVLVLLVAVLRWRPIRWSGSAASIPTPPTCCRASIRPRPRTGWAPTRPGATNWCG